MSRGRRWAAAPPIHLTIFADASWDQKSGAAGWGAWFKGAGLEQGAICGGPLRAALQSSGEAEAQALANALHQVDRQGLLAEGVTIMLQSDNVEALSALRMSVGAIDARHKDGSPVPVRRKPMKGPLLLAVAVIEEIVQRHMLRVLVRHVRGHQEGEGRNWVNRECDRLAKEGMRARRAELQQKEPA